MVELLKLYVENFQHIETCYKVELFKMICKDVLGFWPIFLKTVYIAYNYTINDSNIILYYVGLDIMFEQKYDKNKFEKHFRLFDDQITYQYFCDKLPIKLYDEIMEKLKSKF